MFMAYMVYRTCCKVSGGLDPGYSPRMMFNIILDFFIGLVPVLGDLGDALFKANTRNAVLLYEMLEKRARGEMTIRAQNEHISSQSNGAVNHQLIRADNHMRYGSARHNEPSVPPPSYDTAVGNGERPARKPASGSRLGIGGRGQHSGGGWLSSFGKRNAEPDLERGDEVRPVPPPRPEE
jgi:Domain of unknown function (DUF4112)